MSSGRGRGVGGGRGRGTPALGIAPGTGHANAKGVPGKGWLPPVLPPAQRVGKGHHQRPFLPPQQLPERPTPRPKPNGEPFAECVSFAGRREDFVIAMDTFIPAACYEAFFELSALVEGARVRGLRVSSTTGKCKWRAVRVEGIDAPSSSGRGRGGGSATAGGGEPFSAVVSYAGRAEQFVIAGGSTYVPAMLIAAWKPVFEGDTLEGRRVANSGTWTVPNSQYVPLPLDALQWLTFLWQAARASGAQRSCQPSRVRRGRRLARTTRGWRARMSC